MLRRRSKRRRNSSSLRYKQRAPIGIGRTRSATKAAKAARRRDAIRSTREAVFARDGRCRYTGEARSDDEMHEVESRAKLRGRPPEEIFNTRNCIRLGREVHHRVTAKTLRIVYASLELGCDGPVAFVERVEGED